MKKLLKFANASFLFALVMMLSIEIYLWYTGQELYDTHLLPKIALIKDFAFLIGISCYMIIIGRMVSDYVNPPVRKNKFGEAEIGFTQIERDPEGEEVRRQSYNFTFAHTIASDDQLASIIAAWHINRDKKGETPTVEGLCEYVNTRTEYLACTTKDELIERLKNK